MSNLFKRLEIWGSRVGLVSRSCAAGFLTAFWMGLLLAESGHFSALIALLTGLVTGCFFWMYFRRRQAYCAMPKAKFFGLLAAATLALFSLIFTIPPSEFLLGGWDPGVYVHTASELARNGELLQEVSDLATLDADCRMLIGRQGHNAWEPFLGMRMLPDGRISPQFYHLYPVLMALMWPFGGVKVALLVNPLLNALSILLLYLWARSWGRQFCWWRMRNQCA